MRSSALEGSSAAFAAAQSIRVSSVMGAVVMGACPAGAPLLKKRSMSTIQDSAPRSTAGRPGIKGSVMIRPAGAEDLPAVSRLAAELVRMHHRLDPPRFMLVEPVEDGYQWFFSRELARREARILVAEENGRILGYAYATLEGRNWNDLLDACGKLNDLYVDAGARRRGLARALVDATFAWFRER